MGQVEQPEESQAGKLEKGVLFSTKNRFTLGQVFDLVVKLSVPHTGEPGFDSQLHSELQLPAQVGPEGPK